MTSAADILAAPIKTSTFATVEKDMSKALTSIGVGTFVFLVLLLCFIVNTMKLFADGMPFDIVDIVNIGVSVGCAIGTVGGGMYATFAWTRFISLQTLYLTKLLSKK